jgi:DNA mismatch repair protein MutS2
MTRFSADTRGLRPGDRVIGETPAIRGRVVRIEGESVVLETMLGAVVVPAARLRRDAPAPPPVTGRFSRPKHPEAGAVTVHYDDDPLDDALDLHGRRAEDVESLVSQFIDQAMLRGLHRVKINHGKGTGTLAREVKRCLKTMRHVEKTEIAQPYEGSLGVTVAWLK